MSVIVAIKENDVVYMGADSQLTIGKKKLNTLNETSFKITKLDSGMLVGICGSVSMGQAFLSREDVFTFDERGELTKEHIVKKTIPNLLETTKQIGTEKKGTLDVDVLLANKDKLFYITGELDVLSFNEYGCSGEGSVYTHYVLCERKDLPPKERILKALTVSAKRTESVSGPYVLIDTKDLTFDVVDMGGENY